MKRYDIVAAEIPDEVAKGIIIFEEPDGEWVRWEDLEIARRTNEELVKWYGRLALEYRSALRTCRDALAKFDAFLVREADVLANCGYWVEGGDNAMPIDELRAALATAEAVLNVKALLEDESAGSRIDELARVIAEKILRGDHEARSSQ